MSSPEPIKEQYASEDDAGSGNGSSGGGSGRKEFEYFGWVFHLGVNKIGHEYCHLRFLYLKGRYALMYKRDPHEYPGTKPIRKGVISHTLMVEELGRREVNKQDYYVLKLYNRVDETKKGEIACASAGEAREWIEAFDKAKQQAEYDILQGGSRHKLSQENELDFEGHRPRVRRYAHGLKKLIRIGKGPERLLRQSSDPGIHTTGDIYYEKDDGDAIDAHTWKCVHTLNGIRIFEDVTESKGGKTVLVKSVGVVDAGLDTVFETILCRDKHKRYEWDTVTADLELLEEVDGHCDVMYGTYNPKYLSRWSSKIDFVFSRHWFRGQDGSYTILQSPVRKKRPRKSGYQHSKINPSTWEIRRLGPAQSTGSEKCLVTHMLEIHPSFWERWKIHSPKLEKTVPYALLCQVAGIREYLRANPALTLNFPSTTVQTNISDMPRVSPEIDDLELKDEFYDAIANNDAFEDDDSDDDDDKDIVEPSKRSGSTKLRNVSWAITGLALKRTAALAEKVELDTTIPPVNIDFDQFQGSLHKSKDETDTNCWASPSGKGFMVRAKTYLRDSSKVTGGDPLLKLVAVDWFKNEDTMDKVALHPKCLVQTEAGKKLPFVLVINLQIPAKPNYSLVLYYAADRPVAKDSLLGRFVDGNDVFRDSRFKLIPSIVEGYWMVKRAVGTKACLLGKAVTCRYHRQDNFLEIDVDIGSSSVARSIIGLVLGYVTSLVVDLAILVEAKEEKELPEYILGTVRLNRVRPATATQF